VGQKNQGPDSEAGKVKGEKANGRHFKQVEWHEQRLGGSLITSPKMFVL
jgi:hypothetical protein